MFEKLPEALRDIGATSHPKGFARAEISRDGVLKGCLTTDLTRWPGFLDGPKQAQYASDRNPVVRQATGPLDGAPGYVVLPGAPPMFQPATYSGADTFCGHPSVRPSCSKNKINQQ